MFVDCFKEKNLNRFLKKIKKPKKLQFIKNKFIKINRKSKCQENTFKY